jgi:hypothetical protein
MFMLLAVLNSRNLQVYQVTRDELIAAWKGAPLRWAVDIIASPAPRTVIALDALPAPPLSRPASWY